MVYSFNDLFNTHMHLYPSHDVDIIYQETSTSEKEQPKNVMTVIDDFCVVAEKMQTLVEKLDIIVDDPAYSFYEEEFHTIAKRWKELGDMRAKLLSEITNKNDIPDMNEYIKNLCELSKLNKERLSIKQEINDTISKPFIEKEKILQDENDALIRENKRLEDSIKEMSMHATRYSTIKESEIERLTKALEKSKLDYDSLASKQSVSNEAKRLTELQKRIEELVYIAQI